MDEVRTTTSGLDWNKIIAETIVKHEEIFFKGISSSVQREYKKAKISKAGVLGYALYSFLN